MLHEIADGVLVHQSAFLQSNAVVVRGPAGCLLIDAGVTSQEMTCLAHDLAASGQTVVAGFSTHPHWDHLLWHPLLGSAPRHGSARCAATAQARLSDPGAKARVASAIPPDIVDDVPLDLLGALTGLPAGTEQIPWDGPRVRIIEHQAHAPGHTALLIEDSRVLVAGDMLSDVLIPMLDLAGASDPAADYLAALQLFDDLAGSLDAVVPGHGSVADAQQARARITLDRAYVQALRDAQAVHDPRLEPSAPNGAWLPDVHARQADQLARGRAPEQALD